MAAHQSRLRIRREERLRPVRRSPRSNWLGTDDVGRDVLARLIYGFRVSVLFGLVLTIISSIISVVASADLQALQRLD